MRDPAGEKGKSEEARAEARTGAAAVRRNREEKERKKQRLSSEMLKRKWTKESGSQAPAPERKLERGSPVEQLRERSREGRKETNREPSTRTWKEGMRDQAGEKGQTEEARAETGTAEATVRRRQEERERKNRGLSSQNRKRSGRKEAERKGKARRRKRKGST